MAFIQVTWSSDNAPLHINVDNIISVRTVGDYTILGVTIASDRQRPFEYYVTEPLNDVMTRINNALVFAPGA